MHRVHRSSPLAGRAAIRGRWPFALTLCAALVLALGVTDSAADAQCTCSGLVDAWGHPVDAALVACGDTVCGQTAGSGDQLYACGAGGWSAIAGSTCNTGAGATLHVDDCAGSGGSGTLADPYCDLQTAIDIAADGDTLLLADGTYAGAATPYVDPTCGNCAPGYLDSQGNECWPFRQSIPVTYGFRVLGKSLTLRGTSRTGTVLDTGSAYGLLFDHAGTSRVETLTVTGGVRSARIEATDGAIVSRSTHLTVDRVDLVDNDDLRDYTVPAGRENCGAADVSMGIVGVAGREASELTVSNSNVLRNSWDGITLYQSDPAIGDAVDATLVDNLIGDGKNPDRGDGIGFTHDSGGLVLRNTVFGTVKGIGAFGTNTLELRNNIVHSLGWWAVFVSGGSTMTAANNVIDLNDAGSVGFWSGSNSSRFENNLVMGDGAGIQGGAGTYRYNNITPAAGGGLSGNGNISAAPMVYDAAGHDYRPRCGSPLIDAGDPRGAANDTDGSRNDIGAFGGPQAPPHVKPPCCTCSNGIDYWGNVIDAADTYCGLVICGGDDQNYQCTETGWVGIGGSPCSVNACTCTNGADYWGDPVDPADTYCGFVVCGQDNQEYECTDTGWVGIGNAPCTEPTSCTCTGGVDYWGNPVDPADTDCGDTVCGGDNQSYECTETGWTALGDFPCAGS